MVKEFGVEEAAASGVFAKTREQKETVLATMAMMKIPNVIRKQAIKIKRKLNKKIAKGYKKMDDLNTKKSRIVCGVRKNEVELSGADTTVDEWDL